MTSLKRYQTLIASLLIAALLAWTGPIPASANEADQIVAEPYPNQQHVAYTMQFTVDEAIPSSVDGGSLMIVFPPAYNSLLPDPETFRSNMDLYSELSGVYTYFDSTTITGNITAASPYIQIGLDKPIPAGSYVNVYFDHTAGITNPGAGTYPFKVGKTGGTLRNIPFTVISGSSVSNFTVTTDQAGSLFSGYSSNGFNDVFGTYNFNFTPSQNLETGDAILVRMPYQYSYGESFFWGTQAIDLGKISVSKNGSPTPGIIGSATTKYDDYFVPALSFTLSSPITAGSNVEIALSNFLRTPDYHHATPGFKEFGIITSSDPIPKTTTHALFSRSVTDYYPDADSYKASTATGYHFKFTVMQHINADSEIVVTFPGGMQMPASMDPANVSINNQPAASAEINGNRLILTPAEDLPSFSSASIDIDQNAGFVNPSSPGYYSFQVQPESDSLAATRRIGIVPASGATLGKQYVDMENDGSLRITATTHTILKGGDTVTVTSPSGSLLSNSGITANDITLEQTSEEGPHTKPSSIIRISDNQLQFTLPADFYIAPDYMLAFRLPNVIAQEYGQHTVMVSTSQETNPLRYDWETGPDNIQNFNVKASTKRPGAQNVAYTFNFQSNVSLKVDDYGYLTLNFPNGMTVPSSINAGAIKVNGTAATDVQINPFSHSVEVSLPVDIPLLSSVTVQIDETAGLSNPAASGTYSFSVYPKWYDSMKAVTGVSFVEVDHVAISGVDSIQIPLTGSTAVHYSASVLDAQENRISGETVTWSLETEIPGVLVNAATGVVTVDGTAESGSFTLVAVSDADPTKRATLQVSLTEAVPGTISLTGLIFQPVDVPLTEPNILHLDLAQSTPTVVNATYSNGAVYSIPLNDIDFSAVSTGIVHVNTDGKITGASQGTTVVSAVYGGFTAQLEVTVSDRLYGPLKSEIDTEHDGLHIDNVVKFIRSRIDLNGDGEFNADDVKMLLNALDSIYTP